MNASGESVGGMMAYYRLKPAQLVVAVDDADLPLGEIRLRSRGSSGGHHGLESIQTHLGTQDFGRLRIGIGRTEDGRREITDYVLTPFSGPDAAVIEKVLTAATEKNGCWLDSGIEKAMNPFNGALKGPGHKG